MKTWAQRNPALARIMLRLGMRMVVAIAIVIVLMPIAEQQGWSPNIAAIFAVLVALVVGAKLAERVAVMWGLPEDTFPTRKDREKKDE
jgi:thiamine transporter ThiT